MSLNWLIKSKKKNCVTCFGCLSVLHSVTAALLNQKPAHRCMFCDANWPMHVGAYTSTNLATIAISQMHHFCQVGTRALEHGWFGRNLNITLLTVGSQYSLFVTGVICHAYWCVQHILWLSSGFVVSAP